MPLFGGSHKRRSKSRSKRARDLPGLAERTEAPNPAIYRAYTPAQPSSCIQPVFPYPRRLVPYGSYSQSAYHLPLPPPTAAQAPYPPHGPPPPYHAGPRTQFCTPWGHQATLSCEGSCECGGVQAQKFVASTNLTFHPPNDALPYIKAECRSYINLSASLTCPMTKPWVPPGTWQQNAMDYVDQEPAAGDPISSKFNDIITSMDLGLFNGDDRDLTIHQQTPFIAPDPPPVGTPMSRGINKALASTAASTNLFSKVWLYGNSRLPPYLPPMKVYIPTYPLLCLAAQYSEQAYKHPRGLEGATQYIDADWRSGTKPMVLKSVPIDDMHTIVFAVRGSQTFMDWAVNLRTAPSSPDGFLDDGGNLCHSGFLSVAKAMVKPVAARLRDMIREKSGRRHCSLVITGHSAGGAVAALLYAHMLSQTIQSELVEVMNLFKRVHCVTFGAPPVSLLPLYKPSGGRWDKSVFFAFINEGDPVAKVNKAYIKSLLHLYALPAPNSGCFSNLANVVKPSTPQANNWAGTPPVWKVPPATLSNAGRPILLRRRGKRSEDVEACLMTLEQLSSVVFGDPMVHEMKVYRRRIEVLATRAVTAKEC